MRKTPIIFYYDKQADERFSAFHVLRARPAHTFQCRINTETTPNNQKYINENVFFLRFFPLFPSTPLSHCEIPFASFMQSSHKKTGLCLARRSFHRKPSFVHSATLNQHQHSGMRNFRMKFVVSRYSYLFGEKVQKRNNAEMNRLSKTL